MSGLQLSCEADPRWGSQPPWVGMGEIEVSGRCPRWLLYPGLLFPHGSLGYSLCVCVGGGFEIGRTPCVTQLGSSLASSCLFSTGFGSVCHPAWPIYFWDRLSQCCPGLAQIHGFIRSFCLSHWSSWGCHTSPGSLCSVRKTLSSVLNCPSGILN